MARFTDEFKRDLAEQTSIVELVGRYVRLTRKGAEWWGCCPFHNEKTASFKVNEARKAYKCFGCGEGGDAISFLMKVDGLGFVDAVRELAERAGMTLPEDELSPEETAAASRRDALFHANELACRYFEETLASPAGAKGRAELQKRGVPADLARRFRVGVAEEGWDGLSLALRRSGIDAGTAHDAGLILPRKSGGGWYDRFRDRLMFPIMAPGGKVIAFGGRTLCGDDAKYINSPESGVYSKGAALYGLHQARQAIHKEDQVLVVEGYFDVLGLARAGIESGVAPCGTALTERQLATLRRHTRNVVMLFDSDEAGQRAANRALELSLAQGLWPSWLSVPDGKDPDDYVREHGAEAMRALVASRRPLLDVYIEHRFAAAGQDRIQQEAALDGIAPLLKDLAPTQRRDYCLVMAGLLGVDTRIVEDRVRTAKRAPPTGQQPEARRPDEPDAPAPARPVSVSTELERLLVRLLVQDLPNVAAVVDDMGAVSWLRSPAAELVVGRLLRAWREGREPSAMELLDDVDDPDLRRDLAGALASDGWLPEAKLEQATQECLIRLRMAWIERRRTRVKRELAGIQQAGAPDLGLAGQLAQDLLQLARELAALKEHLQVVLRT